MTLLHFVRYHRDEAFEVLKWLGPSAFPHLALAKTCWSMYDLYTGFIHGRTQTPLHTVYRDVLQRSPRALTLSGRLREMNPWYRFPRFQADVTTRCLTNLITSDPLGNCVWIEHSPDCQQIALVHNTDTTAVRIHTIARTAQRPGCRHYVAASERTIRCTAPIDQVKFSPDSSRILTLSCDALCVWDAETGKRKHKVTKTPAALGDVAVSSDGRWLGIAYSDDRTIHILDADTGRRHHVYEPYGPTGDGSQEFSFSRNMEFSSNSERLVITKLVATTTEKGCAYLVDVSAQTCRQFEGNGLDNAHFSADNRHLVTGGFPPRIFDAESGKCRHEFHEFTFGGSELKLPIDCHLSPDGTIMVVQCGDRVHLYDVASGSLRNEWVSDTYSLGFSPDGLVFFTCSMLGLNDYIQVWEVATAKCLHKLQTCYTFPSFRVSDGLRINAHMYEDDGVTYKIGSWCVD
jgi:WD40 repeat protein